MHLNVYLLFDPAINSIPRYLLKRNENICPRKGYYMNPHSSFVHCSQNWKKPACALGRGWGDRFGSIHELRRYSVVKEKGLPVNATMWVNLRIIMLSKRRQTPKNTHCVNICTEVKEGEWFLLARRNWLGRGVRELSG